MGVDVVDNDVSSHKQDLSPCQQGRVMVFSVPMRFMGDLIHWLKRPGEWFEVPVVANIPADSEVVSVDANWQRRSVDVMIASAEFPVVEQGYTPRRIPFGEEYNLLRAEIRIVEAKAACETAS